MRCVGFGLTHLFLFFVFHLIPTIAVSVRRMHDIGKSGWWVLIAFVPLIGWIWYLILCCTDSQPGDNQYGPNPKNIGATPPPFQG